MNHNVKAVATFCFILIILLCITTSELGSFISVSNKRYVTTPTIAFGSIGDIINSTAHPDNRVFFIETNNKLTELGPRTYCAIESVLLHNPQAEIFVVLLDKTKLGTIPEFFTKEFPNVNFVKANFAEVTKDTPVEKLGRGSKVSKSKYSLNNISNVLRLVLVYKFGGTYFDTDIIALKPTPLEYSNFIGAVSKTEVNNAILHFQPKHPFLHLAMTDMATDFKGNVWGHQGPQLLDHILLSYCNGQKSIEDLEHYDCPNLSILPQSAAYAIPYVNWNMFYRRKQTPDLLKKLDKSFVTHYWNHMRQRSDLKVHVHQEHPIYHLIQTHCPLTEAELFRHYIGDLYP